MYCKQQYLQSMINSRMNINATLITSSTVILLTLSFHILLMIRQRNIEIKRLIPFRKP
ncbi:hypothetical protein Hanom_Chr10g00879981 [Helianthus anomalus]